MTSTRLKNIFFCRLKKKQATMAVDRQVSKIKVALIFIGQLRALHTDARHLPFLPRFGGKWMYLQD